MYVLGIETSCDETAASVVKGGDCVLSHALSSSLNLHKRFGGIVPEIAFRMQIKTITAVAREAVDRSGIALKEIGLICVTNGPGLLGSLLVGVSFAKALSLSLGVPILGVDHLKGHIFSAFLNHKIAVFPFVALIISGGHTSLFWVKDYDRIETMGSTSDDACGEAFDKVAKILELGYPGGPLIERLSRQGQAQKIRFSCSNAKKPLDFSFSGIKTAVLYYARRQKALTNRIKKDIAASFQEAVINTLISKALLACRIKKSKILVIGGGVAANNRLRKRFCQESALEGIDCYFPKNEFCMDNAAMVASLGFHLYKKGRRSSLDLNVNLD